MAGNMYDAAYELERSIRQSDEYARLKQFYQQVNEDQEAKAMFENFRDLQLKLQQKQMAGEEISQEEWEKAQQTVAQAQANLKIAQLMEAEQRMSVALADINQVLMKPIEELYGTDK